MVSWARSGQRFLGAAARLVAVVAAQRGDGVFILIDVSKTTNLGGTSGTQNVRFCNLQICVSLAPKKWMDDSQIHNSQLANTEIWDTLMHTFQTV
jgi:hypothetical protein